MTKKVRRPMKMHIELRPNSAWDTEGKKLIDSFVLVETRTGVTLRWSTDRKVLEREMRGSQ